MTIRRLSRFGRVWHEGYGPFARQGSDTFMVVSPGGNILWSCDPDTILQFSKRNHDFVKPVEMMGMLNMYGPTVTATEGEENRCSIVQRQNPWRSMDRISWANISAAQTMGQRESSNHAAERKCSKVDLTGHKLRVL